MRNVDTARGDRTAPRVVPGRRPSVTAAARRSILAAIVVAGMAGSVAGAQTDVAYFVNGDRLTGEVKSLDRGKLSFDASATGVIQIEWDEISRLESTTNYEVVLDDGRRLYGALGSTDNAAQVRLQRAGASLDLPMPSVVRMTPIESTVLERIDMSVDLGYSLAKANNLAQTNVGYDFRYRTERYLTQLSLDASTSTSDSAPSSTRVFTNLGIRRFFDDRDWNPFGIGQIERNDELGIERRATVGGGMSRWLRDTNSSRISFGGGLVYSREYDYEGTEPSSDAEAMLAMDLEWFRYDQPELDVSTQFIVFNRLSGTREPRGNLDVNLRWEIFKDFFWAFSIYYSFDQQQGETDSSTDYGSFTSLGWRF